MYKQNYEIRIKRDEGTQFVPIRCTQRQATKCLESLAYAFVEQGVSSVELWLKTRILEKRVSYYNIWRGTHG